MIDKPIINYSGDVTLQSTFRVERDLPIDDRFVVNSEEELLHIHNPYVGMRVSLAGEPKLFILTALPVSNRNNWREVSGTGGSAAGIPVYRSDEEAEKYNAQEYVSLEPLTQVETTPGTEAGYIQTLFQAMRVLENKVMQLLNAFKYGINSYCEDRTAIASTNAEIESTPEEPLWAIDETTLSPIEELYANTPEPGTEPENVILSSNHTFKLINDEEGTFTVDTEKSQITFNNSAAYWEDYNKVLKYLIDPKLFTYITLSSKNLSFNIQKIISKEDEEAGIPAEEKLFELKNLLISDEPYNFLLIISKTVEKNEIETGKNFVWIQATKVSTGSVLLEGYVTLENELITVEKLPVYLSNQYYLNKFITGANTTISKLEMYSRYQDFSYEVIPSQPQDEEEFKFKAAHITIRSVSTPEVLTKLAKLLQQNELIFVELDRTLRIKTSQNKIIILNAGGNYGSDNNEETMATLAEVLEHLKKIGIVTTSGNEDTGYNINLNSVSGFTFISETGIKYNIGVDRYGKIQVEEAEPETLETWSLKNGYNLNPEIITEEGATGKYLLDAEKLYKLVNTTTDPNTGQLKMILKATNYNYCCSRGIIANVLSLGKHAENSDLLLKNDRVRISAFYAPSENDTFYSCTHGFVELENSSDKDIPLNGCYLHLYHFNKTRGVHEVHHVKLKGWIPAGGTYLIRAKKYAEPTDANIVINVDSYDVEWFESDTSSELVDFMMYNHVNSDLPVYLYAFAFTYGLPNLTADEVLLSGNVDTDKWVDLRSTESNLDSKRIYTIKNRRFIDSCRFTSSTTNLQILDNTCKWVTLTENQSLISLAPNSMFRMTFALDPAKQGYTDFTTADTSRGRWNKGSDLQIVTLNEFLEFPKSSLKREVSYYTPKASYLHKNVITDKTKLDHERPNAVTVSFGIDVYNTRCFNWVSGGVYDEYVWIRKQGETSWSAPISSYTTLKTGGDTLNYKINNYEGYNIARKEFYTIEDSKLSDVEVNNTVYARITNTLPGSGDTYTVHKCILSGFALPITTQENDGEVTTVYASNPQTWEYVVGRKNIKNLPDELHSSDIQTFTIYPQDWEGRVYQVTDQQGFHWIEYQVWTAAAEYLNTFIASEMEAEKSNKIFPILINTGDMTQSGARINEWLDYYNGGQCLFNHLEQMNVVGNNDLCGEDVTVMGTGNDPGKSNSYFHHVFYCYEIPFDTSDTSHNHDLILKGRNLTKYAYLPSIYYFETASMMYLMLNSEFTFTTCLSQFGLNVSDIVGAVENDPAVVNVYTGMITYLKGTNVQIQKYYKSYNELQNINFVPVYNTIYHWLNENKNSGSSKKEVVTVCHEMPFTVITNESLTIAKSLSTRTYPTNTTDPTNSLGCHMNQISPCDRAGSYWLSRLLEQFRCKLCLGGHKHTYAISLPLAEYYYYLADDASNTDIYIREINHHKYKNSLNHAPKVMLESLQDEQETEDANGIIKPIVWTVEEPTAVMTNYLTISTSTIDSTLNEYTLNEYTYSYYNKKTPANPDSPTVFSTTKLPLIPIPLEQFAITSASSSQTIDILDYSTLKRNSLEAVNGRYLCYTLAYGKMREEIEKRAVNYFMCQATGYKVVSNKELPSADQMFSHIIPQTNYVVNEKTNKFEDGVNNNLLYPMFIKLNINKNSNKVNSYDVYLGRLTNIGNTKDGKFTFTQTKYSNKPITVEYLESEKYKIDDESPEKVVPVTNYGTWSSSNGAVRTITL